MKQENTWNIIHNILDDATEQFIDSMIDDNLLKHIEFTIHQHLRKFVLDDAQYIDFRLEVNKDRIDIFPNNLYTSLILHGIKVPYFLVKDKTEFETEIGTFQFECGIAYIKPLVPVETISINFNIG